MAQIAALHANISVYICVCVCVCDVTNLHQGSVTCLACVAQALLTPCVCVSIDRLPVFRMQSLSLPVLFPVCITLYLSPFCVQSFVYFYTVFVSPAAGVSLHDLYGYYCLMPRVRIEQISLLALFCYGDRTDPAPYRE